MDKVKPTGRRTVKEDERNIKGKHGKKEKNLAASHFKGMVLVSLVILSSSTFASGLGLTLDVARSFHGQAIRTSGELPHYAVWSRSGGWTGDNVGSAVWSNGSAVYCVGRVSGEGAGNYDVVVVKYDENGTRLWSRTWGGPSDDFGSDIWVVGDAVFTCGVTGSYGAGAGDMVLIKWDGNGNQIWNRTWGWSTSADSAASMWVNDTAIFTVGTTTTYEVGTTDLVLVRWDMAGNPVWNRTWGGQEVVGGFDIWGDGVNIFTCGARYDAVKEEALLIKWSGAGIQLWNRTFDRSGDDAFHGIWGANGYVYTAGNTWNGALLVKWNATSGAQLWNRTGDYLPNVILFSLDGDGSGELYTCGWDDLTDYTLFLARWDDEGNCTWSRTYSGSSTFSAGQDAMIDGSYLYTCGYYQRPWPGGLDMVLTKWAPNIAPAITSPADMNCTFGTIGNTLSWIVTDTSVEASTCQVFRNGVLDKSGTWESGVLFIYSVDGLVSGSYNCTIVVSDGAGGTVSDTVIVTVTFPTMLVAGVTAGVAAAFIIGAGITIRSKKQRNTRKIIP